MYENVAELERRYQVLFSQYQTGAIDEATFTAEIDRLQFQDSYGRYWMIGAQSGSWHYYDGQSWHQADPRDSDGLPFMDAQGRYWQKGAKSGDWYYFQPETNEWVKPGQGDPTSPVVPQSQPQPQQHPQQQQQYTPPQPQPQPQQPAAAPAAAQMESQLFQDDEGRYWSMGSKSGQWYFYDANGWHPAHEFESRTGRAQPATNFPPAAQPTTYSQPPAPTPAPASQGYTPQPPAAAYSGAAAAPAQPQPQQPMPQQPMPAVYESQPVYHAQPPQPAAGAASTPPPAPPGQSGSWFYFDGNQWLQYANNQPATDAPPDPNLIVEQKPAEKSAAPRVEAKPKSEPIVAEFVQEDEPPVEVVDVEVITVIEPEPQPAPQPQPAPAAPSPLPYAAAGLAAAGLATAAHTAAEPPITEFEPDEEPYQPGKSRPTSPLSVDEVIPRREKTSPDLPAGRRSPSTPIEPERVPPRRTATSTDPSRPASPRQRATRAPQEPTIILPTGPATATPASARSSRPTVPLPAQSRRAREDTLPMKPAVPPADSPSAPTPAQTRHRQVTQSMPAVSRAPSAPVPTAAPAAPAPQKSSPPSAQPTAPIPAVAPKPAQQPPSTPATPEPEKEGFTLGDILRAFPSTLWTGLAGVSVLLIFAILIIGAFMYGSSLFGSNSVAAVEISTPTLEAGPPDASPTPGPTPTEAGGVVSTPTQAAMTTFSSTDLDITLEHPENWETADDGTVASFSPSAEGLSTTAFNDATMRIGQSEQSEVGITDLLTEVLGAFPDNFETLNEGTISIAAQTWTSTQIRFDDENLGEQGIATVAVTNRDGIGYYLMAVAPAADWNSVQPVFQSMINSFRFGAEAVVAQSNATPATASSKTTTSTPAATSATAEAGSEEETTPTPAATRTPTAIPTPTPEADATPLVYAVKSGDTFLGIANRFGVDLDLLIEENGLSEDSVLQIGQELVIPFTAEELANYNAGQNPGPATAADSAAATDEPADSGDASAAAPTEAASDGADGAADSTADSAPPATEEPATDAAAVSGRIVYPAFNNSTGVYDVWMIDLGSGEQTPIAGGASQPAFNKDGSLLAYRSWDRSSRGIFFRDFIGGRGDIVTRFVEDGLPTWSPDGFSFAFSSRKEGDRVPRIYVGNQQAQDPFAVGFQGEYVSTMPDGRLAVKGCTPTGDCGMFIIGPRGGGEKKISDDPSDTAPAPSPDGSKLAFMSYNRSGNNWEIWVINTDGSGMKRLTEDGAADGLPAWSPDGQSIAFVSNRGGVWAMWVMNADGSNQRKLFDMKGPPDGKILYDEFNSRGWLEERISWAP